MYRISPRALEGSRGGNFVDTVQEAGRVLVPTAFHYQLANRKMCAAETVSPGRRLVYPNGHGRWHLMTIPYPQCLFLRLSPVYPRHRKGFVSSEKECLPT